eukprot:TRINITY_DN38492_c0_g1_i6.p1 TRINITY_DN38492_c0_g1~~TRINITY_DN38492_c0_g1_i6.p1  ORF type:complete len:430 (-),score=42.29 TRINITY_DN38492_c0_g1_i6:162-1451(-)
MWFLLPLLMCIPAVDTLVIFQLTTPTCALGTVAAPTQFTGSAIGEAYTLGCRTDASSNSVEFKCSAAGVPSVDWHSGDTTCGGVTKTTVFDDQCTKRRIASSSPNSYGYVNQAAACLTVETYISFRSCTGSGAAFTYTDTGALAYPLGYCMNGIQFTHAAGDAVYHARDCSGADLGAYALDVCTAGSVRSIVTEPTTAPTTAPTSAPTSSSAPTLAPTSAPTFANGFAVESTITIDGVSTSDAKDPDFQNALKITLAGILGIAKGHIALIFSSRRTTTVTYQAQATSQAQASAASAAVASSTGVMTTLNANLASTGYSGATPTGVTAATPTITAVGVTSSDESSSDDTVLIVGLAVGGAVLVAVIIVAFVVWSRKSVEKVAVAAPASLVNVPMPSKLDVEQARKTDLVDKRFVVQQPQELVVVTVLGSA